MKTLQARRSFWNGENEKREMIRRGEVFETNEYHAAQLIKNHIAREVSTETQDNRPSETPTVGPSNLQTLDYSEVPTAAPQEIKELPPTVEPEPLPDLESLTVSQLRAKAKEAGIKGYSDMNKKKLIQNLKGVL